MKLTTERLILRKLRESDAKELVKRINNLNISKWLSVVPYPYGINDAKEYINYVVKIFKEEPQTGYEFAVERKNISGVIGGFGISNINKELGTGELGYWLGEDYWRKGYASEGISKLIDYAFNTINLRKLTIPAFKTNKGSNGLAKSLGFTYEGCLKKAGKCKATGKIHDENLWVLLKEEWTNKKI